MSHDHDAKPLPWSALALRLQGWMTAAGVTTMALASAVGLDRSAVAHWLSGRSRPEAGKLAAVAVALGLDAAAARELYQLAGIDVAPLLSETPSEAA